jgi:molybdopterin adenylyltransferase
MPKREKVDAPVLAAVTGAVLVGGRRRSPDGRLHSCGVLGRGHVRSPHRRVTPSRTPHPCKVITSESRQKVHSPSQKLAKLAVMNQKRWRSRDVALWWVAMDDTTPAPIDPTPRPVRLAILTVSDTRTEATDTSGALLADRARNAGHDVVARQIVLDERERITDAIARFTSPPIGAEVILITGGTGITGRDVTVDAVEPLIDKPIPGFGELFRILSYADIGPSTIASRALAGRVGAAIVFALPGSTGACRLAWDKILQHQLDIRSKPCNLVSLFPRFAE